MNIVTLDFETYFDADYTLKKLTTEAYIRDPRFQVLGVGVRWPSGECCWYEPERVIVAMQAVHDSGAAVLCHHAHFDGLILSHHYGVRPHAWLDTLSMARLLRGNHLRAGLDSLARDYGLGAKNVPYDLFKGKSWVELSPGVQRQVSEGCLHDVELTWQLFNILAKDFPVEEYPIVDMTVRMFTEPVLRGDIEGLGKVWFDERDRKAALLSALGVGADALRSDAQFIELLRAAGVDVPTKPGKNGPIPATAKTDAFMKGLLEDEDDRVRTLAEARLGVQSSIDQTRAERLGDMATRGPMAVYLNYAGAHTTRWSGGDRVNWQNFKRGGGIRKAIQAPEGCKIVKADKAQVECRFLNMVAGQWDVIENFRLRKDPYVGVASAFYGEEVTPADKPRRNFGKVLELASGYGMGPNRLRDICRQGPMGAPPIVLEPHEAQRGIDAYRSTHPAVVQLWKDAGRMIARLGGGQRIAWGPVTVETGCITLPNGAPMLYPELHYYRDPESGDEYWRYRQRNGWAKIYGAKLVENVIQALSRVDMSQTLLRIRARMPEIKFVNLEHDAAIAVTLDKHTVAAQAVFLEEFSRAPAWMPDIPLDAEVTTGDRYG